MDGVRNTNNEKPNAEESKHFWSNMRYNQSKYKRNAEWLKELRAAKDNIKQ